MKSPKNRDRAHGSRGPCQLDRKNDRKTQQLCRQVYRVLAYAIPGDMADPLLQELTLEEVVPAPDASRLLVRLGSPQPVAEATCIPEQLARVEGYLRAQVAGGITRKRAPELTFHVVCRGEVKP